MIDSRAEHPTTTPLLATLRQIAGDPDLAFDGEPTPLTGGFYAEMLRFRLLDPPAELAGDLVARIVPNPAYGAWEGCVQTHVADQGFATPRVRAVHGADSPLGRYLIVMDHVDGAPPMGGLSLTTVAAQIPALVRRLPAQLAQVAADLHALDPTPLGDALDRLDTDLPATTAAFVARQGDHASALGRQDLSAAASRLLDTEPASPARAIAHGDLHPFNILITSDGPVLVDWTVAHIAHPAFTLAFTDLMLSHPPLPLPKIGTAALAPVGRAMSRRFLSTYDRVATPGTRVTEADLAWHRRVHALRILVEVAGWDVAGTRPTRGHPWLSLEPVAARLLDLAPPGR